MFEKVLSRRFHLNRHRNGPYAEERERYLALLMQEGRSRSILKAVTTLLYCMAEQLPLHCTIVVPAQIEAAARRWSATLGGVQSYRHNMERWFVFHATNWLRMLGRLQEPVLRLPFAAELDAFLHFEQQERGFADATVEREKRSLRRFLRWAASQVKTLREIAPEDISRYFGWQSTQRRWKRTTISVHVSALRNFFRFAQSMSWCVPDLAGAIDAPRIYRLERLPRGPQWNDVQRLLAASSGNTPNDIRDHAMLLLLTVYGLRSGEVRHLCLDDIDWEQEVIRVRRPKQRKTQRYPLLLAVGDAILRYLREVRPRCSRREVFVTRVQPFRPLTAPGFGTMVRKRLLRLGLTLPCHGPHALRHSCATHLLAEGFTLKDIADHLGHVSLAATQVYAKTDIGALREVGQLDLSGLAAHTERSAHLATPIYPRGSMEALQAVAAISLGGLL
jgi:site-specific recombinase XerD